MRNLLDLTNAADRAAAAQTNHERTQRVAFQRTPTLVAGVANTIIGPPVADVPHPYAGGDWAVDDLWVDSLGSLHRCTGDGNPGDWVQIDEAIVADATARDALAEVPVGYRVITADDGKRFIFDDPAWTEIGGGGGAALPSGAIIMWSGSIETIPAGWFLCDGANGTPDLQNKFIRGASEDLIPGDTGGSEVHSHHVAQSTQETDAVLNTGVDLVDASGGGDIQKSTAHTHDMEFDTADANSLPPFYVLAFIMKS